MTFNSSPLSPIAPTSSQFWLHWCPLSFTSRIEIYRSWAQAYNMLYTWHPVLHPWCWWCHRSPDISTTSFCPPPAWTREEQKRLFRIPRICHSGSSLILSCRGFPSFISEHSPSIQRCFMPWVLIPALWKAPLRIESRCNSPCFVRINQELCLNFLLNQSGG